MESGAEVEKKGGDKARSGMDYRLDVRSGS